MRTIKYWFHCIGNTVNPTHITFIVSSLQVLSMIELCLTLLQFHTYHSHLIFLAHRESHGNIFERIASVIMPHLTLTEYRHITSNLTIAKPERRAEVLLDAFSFALLSCSFLQERYPGVWRPSPDCDIFS